MNPVNKNPLSTQSPRGIAVDDALNKILEMITPIQTDPATWSPTNTLLYQRIGEVLKELDSAEVIPFMGPGLTDSRYFRNKGIPAYGCCHMKKDSDMSREEALRLAHGKNERISRDNLLLEANFLYNLIKKF